MWSRLERRRARRKRFKRAFVVGAVLGLLLVLAGWAGLDLARTRTQLVRARATLQAAVAQPAALSSAEGRQGARREMALVLDELNEARGRLTANPVLAAAGAVPLLRTQPDGLLRLVDDARSATTEARRLMDQIDGLADRTQVRSGLIPLDGLRELQHGVSDAALRVRDLARSSPGLIGPLGSARRQFDDLLRSTSTRLSETGEAIGAARAFLGAAGDRRYLLAMLNNAEMRDQGMVLSFATVQLSGGVFSIGRSASVQEVRLDRPAATPIPEGTQAVFGPLLPTQFWHSVNATADFAWSGTAMVDMYQQATGTRLDGVVAIDVPGMAALLRAIGPVTVEGVAEPVTSDNVGRIVLHDFYQGLTTDADQTPRRERQADVTQAVVERLTSGARDAVVLGQQLGEAAAGGHLRLWSADDQEEKVFERSGLGGPPAVDHADRTFHIAVQNRTATKLDYFVKTHVRHDVRLTEGGDAVVKTTVEVENQVPVGAAPSYQLGPDQYMSGPGEYLAWLLLWSPAGSRQPGSIRESGLELSQHVLRVGPGQRVPLTFVETVIPKAVRNGELMLRFVPQPRLEPATLDVRVRADGWRLEGPRSFVGPWDKVQTLRLKARR